MKLERATVKSDLIRLIDSKTAPGLSTKEVSELTAMLKPKSGWKDFKLTGYHMLSGESRSSFDKLSAALRDIGIFIVHLGELERFHPEVSGANNKAEWLRVVLEKKLYEQSIEARDFMTAAASNIVARQ